MNVSVTVGSEGFALTQELLVARSTAVSPTEAVELLRRLQIVLTDFTEEVTTGVATKWLKLREGPRA